MYTALENSPITIYIPTAVNDTGWSQDGVTATHVTCNAGLITLLNFPVIAGHTYKVSYAVLTISSGSVQLRAGGTTGVSRTTANIYVENITATTNGVIQFYSNANCTIQSFNAQDVTVQDGLTIVYSAINKKWSDIRTYYPDFGFSLFTRSLTLYNGALYNHDPSVALRNNFYGNQFQSSVKFVENKNSATIRAFQSLNYQSNELLITTTDGITTSLGQVSELIDTDFLLDTITDGISTINIYERDSVYAANFLRDKNTDINTGDPLRGNFAIIELVTTDGSKNVTLFTVEVQTAQVKTGSR